MTPRNLRGAVDVPVQLKFTVDVRIKERVESMTGRVHTSNSYFFTKLIEHTATEFENGAIPQWWIDAHRDPEGLPIDTD